LPELDDVVVDGVIVLGPYEQAINEIKKILNASYMENRRRMYLT
jgi:hypothetical protein